MADQYTVDRIMDMYSSADDDTQKAVDARMKDLHRLRRGFNAIVKEFVKNKKASQDSGN